ncbi:MAG: diaminopimelate decarboxylase [Bacteroidaceae bacterium]|nr:diaminopimelate decarboxylase [Bacteroidaceae bacterium]
MVKRLFQELRNDFEKIHTPFYYYDTVLLAETLESIKKEADKIADCHIHYAVKACANPRILKQIQQAGFGADCVSGGEIKACMECGFPANEIVFAGVGKADWEIELALNAGIQYFNVESIPELEVIAEIAERMGKVADVSFRINPNVGAHTHANITTGLAENKFGIAMKDMVGTIRTCSQFRNIRFVGLHFHIGSQILKMDDFEALCLRINELQDMLEAEGITEVKNINVGGGLGIDYQNPDENAVPDFKAYFQTYAKHLKLRPGQRLHFELGRAVVGQCGSLVTRCLYVKKTDYKQFVIADAGMTELLRPALYDAYHCIQNICSTAPEQTYDVVGPICESSDTFAKGRLLPETKRGDLLVIRSAGAYGETMSSQYNCRVLPKSYTTEDFA